MIITIIIIELEPQLAHEISHANKEGNYLK